MHNDNDRSEIDQDSIYLEKLHSLHKAVMRLKNMLFYCVPSHQYDVNSEIFWAANVEAKTLIIGKLYVLLTDDKFKKHNNISFRILIEDIMRNPNLTDEQREDIKHYFNNIKKINKNYRLFRNKFFAHVELNADGSLPITDGFGFSDRSIHELFAIAEDMYKGLLSFLSNAPSVSVEKQQETDLRKKVFECYIDAGLIQKRA